MHTNVIKTTNLRSMVSFMYKYCALKYDFKKSIENKQFQGAKREKETVSSSPVA